MNPKILLVKPNILSRKGFFLHSRMCPPIGLAYIAAPLLEHGYEVKIIDMVAEAPDVQWKYNDTHIAYGMTCDSLIEQVRIFGPDIVGIGGFTSQFGCVRDMVAAIKTYDPDIRIVLGGANATALSEYVLERTRADYVIQGEGETALPELVRGLQTGDQERIRAIDGLGYRQDGGRVMINQKQHHIKEIDTIAWPARQLLNHSHYIEDGVAMPVITSRSCPGRCTFCSVHLMTGMKWRARDPLDVADEIEHLVSTWGYQTVSIFDDAANVVPDRLVTICKEVVRRNLGIRLIFPSSLILKYITRDLLYWMKQAGSVGLSLPIEHANTHMRNRVIRKKLDLEEVDRVLDWCRELKLLTVSNFVIGMPGETEETLQELVAYVADNAPRMDAVSVYAATPFPGTPFYNQCLAEKLIRNPDQNDFLDFDTYTVHIVTREVSGEMLLDYKKRIEQTFLDVRGPDFPADYIRKVFRKPDEEGLNYLYTSYFN